MRIHRCLRRFILALSALCLALPAFADMCSAWVDKAWLNEYFFGQNPFLEVFSKNSAFPAAWQNWSIDVYDRQNTLMISTVLNSTTGAFACTKSGNKTWVTKDISDSGFHGTLGLAILKDSEGKYVDAFVFDNKAPPAPWENSNSNYFPTLSDATNGCSTLVTKLNSQATLSSTKSNQANMIIWSSQGNKDYSRVPDGGSSSGGNPWYITSETGAGTTYTTCTTNLANLSKTVDVANVAAGGTVNFKITFANTASTAITGSLYVIDTLPTTSPTMTFVSATSSNSSDTVQYSTGSDCSTATYSSTASSPTCIKWTPSNLAGNSSTTLTVKMTVPSGAAANTTYTNSATTGGLALTTQQTDDVTVTVVDAATKSFAISTSTTSACTSATGSSAPKITVTAKTQVNGGGTTLDTYTGTVTLGTSSGKGTWSLASGAGSFNAAAKTYTFAASDKGVASFYLEDSTAETIDVTATDAASYSTAMWGIYSSITYGTTCSSLHHVEFVHDGSGINCMAEPVTVYGCTTSASCYSSGTNQTSSSFTVTPTAISGATWCADSSCSTTLSTSSATTMTNGTVIYLKDTRTTAPTDRLAGTSSGSTSTVQCVNSSTSAFNSTNACDLAFANAGFIISSAANGSALSSIETQTAGTSSSTYYLRAVQTNSSTKACTSALTGTTTVNWAYACNDPTTCYSTNLMTLNGGGSTTISGNANGSVSTYTPVSMTFDSNGNAPFTFNYSDVGKVTLYAKKTASGTLTADLTGSSPAFVVKPYGFAFSNIKCSTATSSSCAPGAMAQSTAGTNPAASSYTESSFIYAGSRFSATVTAVTSGGNATPNYGKESSPESVVLTATLAAPSGGTSGTLGGTTTISGGAFSSGAASVTDLTYSEVGIITLTAAVADSDYLGAGSVSATSGNIGRFIPHHFALTSGSITAACTGTSGTAFTYFGQDGFTTKFTLTAQNASNATTTNYSGNYAYLGLTSYSSYKFSAATLATGSSLTASSTAPSGTWSSGAATVTAKHQISRPASITAPNTITISAQPTDSDSVTTTSSTSIATALLRYGRLRLSNAYGTGALDLSVFGQTEYYNGSVWVINGDDSCTVVGTPTVTLSSSTINTSPKSKYSTSWLVSGGDVGLYMLAPGSGIYGYADVSFASTPSYLIYSSLANNTKARAVFGISKSNSKVIYRRERY